MKLSLTIAALVLVASFAAAGFMPAPAAPPVPIPALRCIRVVSEAGTTKMQVVVRNDSGEELVYTRTGSRLDCFRARLVAEDGSDVYLFEQPTELGHFMAPMASERETLASGKGVLLEYTFVSPLAPAAAALIKRGGVCNMKMNWSVELYDKERKVRRVELSETGPVFIEEIKR